MVAGQTVERQGRKNRCPALVFTRQKVVSFGQLERGPAGAPNGVDIVSTVNPALRSFHYRPKAYALFEFVGWNGRDHLAMKVTMEPQVTFPVEGVRGMDRAL